MCIVGTLEGEFDSWWLQRSHLLNLAIAAKETKYNEIIIQIYSLTYIFALILKGASVSAFLRCITFLLFAFHPFRIIAIATKDTVI